MITIHRQSDIHSLTKQAADAITDAITQWKNDAVLLLFSGGSPLEIVKVLDPKGFDARITMGVSDERFSTDPTINNFAQLCAMPWYTSVISQGSVAIDTRSHADETVETAGVRFNTELKQWRQQYPNGKIIITQGIGLDGHTVGMMPYPEDAAYFDTTFKSTDHWAVGYDSKDKNKYPFRVTTTIPFLLHVACSIVFVVGKEKQIPMEQVFSSRENLAAVPGRIIHTMPNVHIYTDRTWTNSLL